MRRACNVAAVRHPIPLALGGGMENGSVVRILRVLTNRGEDDEIHGGVYYETRLGFFRRVQRSCSQTIGRGNTKSFFTILLGDLNVYLALQCLR